MDGTLLDLAFDTAFWSRDLPAAYASMADMALAEATTYVAHKLAQKQGTLAWYSLDYWSVEFGLDLVALTKSRADAIGFADRAPQFLRQARAAGLELVLVTNAHPKTLAIKHEQTAILDFVDQAISSHDIGYAKEQPEFWERFAEFTSLDYATAVMIDDSEAVLNTASSWVDVIAIAKPSSVEPSRDMHPHCTVPGVGELIYHF